MKSKQFTLFVL